MKRAGDVLSVFFDERLMKKAQGYSKLFDSWTDITAKNGIAAVADHSRIKDLEKGVLLIETDHPGWKQIIQTKQSKMLNDFRRRFPDLDISAISLMLSRDKPKPNDDSAEAGNAEAATDSAAQTDEAVVAAADMEAHEAPPPEYSLQPPDDNTTANGGYNTIENESFKESLKRLEQSIAEREQSRTKKSKG